eukprot:CAMPEP_0118702434 /NCGR_PEP_ID=MMETSP0800-20121206/17893_1 /TAXON_ID=210618 ORGANISM="Striatella unipunctata, Strain CCMP2910" /NCGR_SAMPLE_ID=MMETSP0800 /ASSEMBLY_ACC=CAM_ASM_000638 /LENGTH=225 /DNA_ID=CAMNT_0006603643 /DNA_START=11 /DNA_END=685 /DNA_ORIENTATION=-
MNKEQDFTSSIASEFPWMCINLLVGASLVSPFVRNLLGANRTIGSKFNKLDEEDQRDVVSFVITGIFTSLALIAQVYGGYDVLVNNSDDMTQDQMDAVYVFLQLTVIFLWEVFFRIHTDPFRRAHHLCCMLLLQFATTTIYDTKNVLYVRVALLLGFQVTTSQLSLFASFAERLDLFPKSKFFLSYVAASATFIIKTAAMVASCYFFQAEFIVKGGDSNPWGEFW